MSTDPQRWLSPRPVEGLRTRLRLVCSAHAGGGPQVFAGWASALPQTVSLCPLRRPDHGDPGSDVHILAHQALEALLTLSPRPMVLYGHSLGAVIAFELARLLDGRGMTPRLLIVSGREAPQSPRLLPPIATLPDERFIAALDERYGGIPTELRDSPDLLIRLLPALRADLAASERYGLRPGPRLRCPLLACHGRFDASVDSEGVDGWAVHTAAGFERHDFPGAHFFPVDPRVAFARWLASRL
ncbi:MAG: thioesterase [Myxococcales bacterium]|nr:thioesterase [Myxococcales bacterium]